MKVLVCTEPGKMEYAEKDIPRPAPHEILLRINKVGVCGTDLHAFTGTQPYFNYPRILGHELCATVADSNGHPNFSSGDLVAVMPYFFCGSCYSCRMGSTNCCSNLKVAGVHIDGGLQEYFTVPSYAVINNTGLTEELITIIEPFSIGEHALGRAGISAGDQMLVLGAGPIGAGIALLGLWRNANVILADTDPYRLSLCEAIPGIELINLQSENLQEEVSRLSKGEGIARIFDATGNLKAIESTLETLAHGGKIILVGLQKESFSFSHPAFHKKETTLMSSRNALLSDFIRVVQFLRDWQPGSFEYISQRLAFADAADWFMDPTIKKNRMIKALIEM